MKQILFTFLLTLLPINTDAATLINGIYYNLSESTSTAEMTRGGTSDYYKYTGNIVIPESVTYNNKNYSVTSIGEKAFYGCNKLNSVTIPKTVTSVGKKAFSDCNALGFVYISDIEAWCNIKFDDMDSNPTRYANRLFLNNKEIIDLVIPQSVKKIDDYAFYFCTNLSSIQIPNSVTSIGVYSFEGCRNLTSVTIPNSVTAIAGGAFADCSGLTSINIPNGVTDLSGTFWGCTSLSSISMPESLINIGGHTFDGCNSLASITIPSNVQFIGVKAFNGCMNLNSVQISNLTTWCNIKFEENSNPLSYAKHLYLNGEEIQDLVIPTNVSVIKSYSFTNCKGLKSVTIPESVTSIGIFVFAGCDGITTITIPKSVTTIGEQAFSGCSSLTSVTIPESMASISKGMFWGCENLTSITIPENVTSIGDDAFKNCYGLAGSIIIPKGVTNIGEGAFYNCRNITSVIIPENLKNINKQTFAYCSSMESVTIPAAVEIINQQAFIGCTSLKMINVQPTIPPLIYDNSFPNFSIPVKVPKGFKETYSKANGWNKFTNISDADKYKLTYVVDGEEYKSFEIEEGEIITPEAAPTKEGYMFSGWSEIPSTMPAKDVTVTGTFTINKYKLVYMVDGVEYKSYEIEYGAKITPETAPTKDGYSFSGWSTIPETMPAQDITITGTFTINKYKLTYIVDGSEYKTFEIEYGTTITPEVAPTKEGFAFSGWSDIPQTMPANDVTITGTFTKSTYKLTYMLDGAEYKTVTYDYSATITPEAAPTKEGYTFSGWSEIPSTMPAQDVTVSGTFTINKYKLTYMVDGVEYKSYQIEYGATITPEETPTKEGYSFSGWSSIPETMPAKDVTVIGTFTRGAYKLIYMVDGEVYKTVSYDYGATITPEAEPTEGSFFSGWSEIPETMPAHDVTVTGIFKYMLMYTIDGQEYKYFWLYYGAVITPEEEPTREGYTFSGWSEIPKTMPANIVNVKGSFITNKYKLVYMVDGVEYKSYQIEYGATITPEVAPTKEGYSFSGWSTIPTTMPAKDVTVTGTFTKGAYKLTYMVDGTVYKTVTYDYGATITPEAAPTKEGCTFSGWSEIPSTMPAQDVTVSGTFTINKYKLIYMVDGAEYKSSEIEYGAKITPEAAPTKEGYSFSGWSTIPETMPAKDVTVTGTFTKGAYKLTYMVDGEVYKTVTYDYGDAITPEPAPTKEGYTFSGWSEIPNTMPAQDVTVTGTFAINRYKLVYMVDGSEYKSYEIEYGAYISPESEPSKDGYTFSGWSEIPTTMPAQDVTVTGTFTQVEFVIDNVAYEISGDGTVAVNGCDQKGEVTIEPTVEINGQTYRVTAIADDAFKNNQDITSLTIPEGITTIGDNAFEGCSGLIVINIGKDVQTIGNKAFANVGTASARTRSEESMLIVNCYAESVPYTASDAFENTPIETGTLYVVDNLKDSYKATSPWSRFGKIIGFEESTGINAITKGSGNTMIFDMQGNRLDNVRKGVSIIRTRDGKTKKVVMK